MPKGNLSSRAVQNSQHKLTLWPWHWLLEEEVHPPYGFVLVSPCRERTMVKIITSYCCNNTFWNFAHLILSHNYLLLWGEKTRHTKLTQFCFYIPLYNDQLGRLCSSVFLTKILMLGQNIFLKQVGKLIRFWLERKMFYEHHTTMPFYCSKNKLRTLLT